MQLIVDTLVLWRGAGEVQLGPDPREAHILTGLSTPQQRFLEALASGALVRAHEVSTAAALCGATDTEVLDVLTHLDERGLVRRPRSVSPAARRASRLARAGVAVLGGSTLGLEIAVALALAGVGGVELVDEGTVTEDDRAQGGYRADAVGHPRSLAAVAELRAVAPRVRIRVPEPDVVVLVEPRVAVPFRSSGLQREDVTHLSVVPRENDVVVGPLVHPGRDACLRCLDLHRADADPAWPALAAQLAVSRPPRPPQALQHAASGLATTEVVQVLGGAESTLAGCTLQIGPGSVPALRTWTTHPSCGCGAT